MVDGRGFLYGYPSGDRLPATLLCYLYAILREIRRRVAKFERGVESGGQSGCHGH